MPGDLLRRPATLLALVIVAIACWSVLTPEGGGPDETAHLVRAAGLARGQFFEDDGAFDVPDTVVPRDIACWAFDPWSPASCAAPRETSGAIVSFPSTAEEYPVWSHLAVGIPSRLPGPSALWWARATTVVLAGALVGASMVAVRRRPLAAASLLVALTPMAWFSFGIVNPSAIAIAGALALWVGMVHRPDLGWLIAVGFTALALPRRDGLIWACLSVALWLLVDDQRFTNWWRSLGIGPRALIAMATASTCVWGLLADNSVSRLVVLAPSIVVAAAIFQRWRSWLAGRGDPTRLLGTIATVIVVIVGVLAVAYRRPRGWDGDLATRVLGEAGPNLVEAIGRLGWLDAPLPGPAIAGWIIVLGLLAGASLGDRTTWVGGAAAVIAVGVVAAWVFELYQGSPTGTYWQGRYTLPLLAGAPIVLGAARLRPEVERRLAVGAGLAALGIANIALWAASRRFGVGLGGSLLPWNWDTYDTPLPVAAVLVVHALATAGLAAAVLHRPASDPR